MSTSYGSDQDAEPPTPDGGQPEVVEAEDATTDDDGSEPDQDADAPDAHTSSEPPD
jgi:hypothetical protein